MQSTHPNYDFLTWLLDGTHPRHRRAGGPWCAIVLRSSLGREPMAARRGPQGAHIVRRLERSNLQPLEPHEPIGSAQALDPQQTSVRCEWSRSPWPTLRSPNTRDCESTRCVTAHPTTCLARARRLRSKPGPSPDAYVSSNNPAGGSITITRASRSTAMTTRSYGTSTDPRARATSSTMPCGNS